MRSQLITIKWLALRLQSLYRGLKVRERNPGVALALSQMRRDRWEECLGATVVRAQSLVRQKLSARFSAARREEIYQRARDMRLGIVKIQRLTRRWNAIVRVIHLREMQEAKCVSIENGNACAAAVPWTPWPQARPRGIPGAPEVPCFVREKGARFAEGMARKNRTYSLSPRA